MDHDRLASLRAWLDATPAETAGLAVLLTGAVVVAALVWWTSVPGGTGTVGRSAPAPVPVPAETAPALLTVHVAGAVHRPGVVTVPYGSRVTDTIDAAGGARPDGVLDTVNLARLVEDGERIHIPSEAEAAATQDGTSGKAGGGQRPDGRIDLNRATAAELEELPGIGPVLAQRIVDHREDHGPFAQVGDLRDVPGIGERTFQSLAELVVV